MDHPCPHLGESLTDINEVFRILTLKHEISCSDCDCRGPNLWLCLRENCGHIGCGEKSNDHNTKHNAANILHSTHMNLSTRRIWCYECKQEVFLDQYKRHSYSNDFDNADRQTIYNKDSGRGSYATLRSGSSDRGAIFENSVGLNVVMSGDGDASDSSDVGDFSEYNSQGRRGGGLVGLQNIGNTCYMNAALQALSNTEPLTRYFIDCGNIVHILSEGKKPGLSRTYQALIRDMWMKKNVNGYVTPSGILYGIRNVHAMFRGYHQHDTQEFLRNFMDQLHEELKQPVAPEISNLTDSDTLSLAMEETQTPPMSFDSSEGEYETCDSGVSERSSLSDDSEPRQIDNTTKSPVCGGVTSKRRHSRCQSPSRRQRPRVVRNVIDSQPSICTPHPKKQVKYHSIISDIFDGKLLSSVQCLTCDRVSSRVETFQDLSLPIPSKDHLVLLHVLVAGRTTSPNATCSDVIVPVQDGWMSWILAWLKSWWYGPVVTLHDCLSAFFSTDELKGDNMYSCEKCSKLRNGVKFSKVLQLPEVLCIHLKRFRHELMYSSKISSAVSFPLTGLDMWPYLHTNNTSKVSKYDLFSVICHHGTAGGGHYTSYATHNNEWFEFDDQYVSKVSPERVQTCEAYVLFYRKVQSSAESTRMKVTKMNEEIDRESEDFKGVYISKQWINKFYYCVEPGPIDNADFLCQHGALDPEKELHLEQLYIEIPLEVYEYLHRKFGGCPPIREPTICPACSALQKRILYELETFAEINRRSHAEQYPRTHYLSMSWYLLWHAFTMKKTLEPPGPINNTKIDLNNLDSDEAAEVPQALWEFFYNIYGGGPTILVNPDKDEVVECPDEATNHESELDVVKANEMGDAPIPASVAKKVNGYSNENTEAMNTENTIESENSTDETSQFNGTENGEILDPSSPKVERKLEEPTEPDLSAKQTPVSVKKGNLYKRKNH